MHRFYASGTEVAYEDDFFGPPWSHAQAALLVHGIAESSQAWTQWVPMLSPQLRVVRPDLPGFGLSPLPADHDCSPHRYGEDLLRLIDGLGLDRVHLVAAKYGGTIALQLAGERPDRLRSLSIFSAPLSRPAKGDAELIKDGGVRHWAARTQRSRLGSAASEDQVTWWTEELMGRADERAVVSCQQALEASSVAHWLPSITVPTMIVTTEESELQSVSTARSYQERIPDSRLKILPGDAYHPAAVQVEQCAALVLEFVQSLNKTAA